MSPSTSPQVNRLLRLDEVCQLAGLRKTTVYKKIRSGQFPKQIQIGAPDAKRGTARWHLAAVNAWIELHTSDQQISLKAPS